MDSQSCDPREVGTVHGVQVKNRAPESLGMEDHRSRDVSFSQRNLICHVYPRSNGRYLRTVDHLRRRWRLFTGRKIIAVALDETTDSLPEVRGAFGDCEAEFLTVRNSELQEVETFVRSLERLAAEPGITFRCHAKGATHLDPRAASHAWADVMFSACLDFPGLIECALSRSAVCGAFRSHGIWGGPGYHNWHFAGSCYWFRNDAAFVRNWRNVHQAFWGAEAWPGIFGIEESVCLFCDRAQTHQLYNVEWWENGLGPSFFHWVRRLESCSLRSPAYIPRDSLLWNWRPTSRRIDRGRLRNLLKAVGRACIDCLAFP